jgi:hypothetical protein
MRGNKFRAVRTEVDGIVFASKREAKRYHELKLLEHIGAISGLELQPAYDITVNCQHICTVKLDFRYVDNSTFSRVIEDSKGVDNPLSRLKRKLVEAQHGIEVMLV